MTPAGDTDRLTARRRPAYVPPQHGAWAFLGLPVVLGALVAPWTPLLLLLVVTWVAAYPWSYAALGLLRARRRERFRRPVLLWTLVVAGAGVPLLLARPWLVWVAAGYLVLFSVNGVYARRNDERALGNDLVLIVECTLMVPVTWAVAVGSGGWRPPPVVNAPPQLWVLAVVCALVLLGSTLHVKSLIRERGDPRYAQASRLTALSALALAPGLAVWWGLAAGLWLLPPFVALAARAFVVPRLGWRPVRIGLLELAMFVLTAVCAAAAVVAA